jgi:hypothetical protein
VYKRHKNLVIEVLYYRWKEWESALHRRAPLIGSNGERGKPEQRTKTTWGKTVFVREMWLEKVRALVPPQTEEDFGALAAALAAEEKTTRVFAHFAAWNAWRLERTDAGEEAVARAKRASDVVAEELCKRSGRFRYGWRYHQKQAAAAAATGGEASALKEMGEGDG